MNLADGLSGIGWSLQTGNREAAIRAYVKNSRFVPIADIGTAQHIAPNHTLTRGQCHLILICMRKKLTPKSIDALPPATGKRCKVHDTLLPGLQLRVSATGGKVFGVLRRVNGRMKRIRIGAYPIVSLAVAREKARDTKLGQY